MPPSTSGETPEVTVDSPGLLSAITGIDRERIWWHSLLAVYLSVAAPFVVGGPLFRAALFCL